MAISDTGISIEGPPATGGTLIVILVFLSISLYNFVELNFIIFMTFKTRHGLYFVSFLVANCGIALYAIGFILKTLKLNTVNWLFVTLIAVGWCMMVTGQSLVLYSRLHLVLYNTKHLRAVLYMIIFNAVILHVPIIVMVYGVNSSNPGPFVTPYSIYEKVQVSVFFAQEVIISSFYIIETTKLMRTQREIRSNVSRRNLMIHLIIVNIVVVLLDIAILAMEYAGHYGLQTSYKALVYSVKLKVEFSILNKLVELTHGSTLSGSCDPTPDVTTSTTCRDAETALRPSPHLERNRHPSQRSALLGYPPNAMSPLPDQNDSRQSEIFNKYQATSRRAYSAPTTSIAS